MDKIKDLLKKDFVMWIGLALIVIIVANLQQDGKVKKLEQSNIKANVEKNIQIDKEKVLKENPDFVFPYTSYQEYFDKGMKAKEIEIKNYKMDSEFKKVEYILKNNYDFDIFITPELLAQAGKTSEFVYYDFNKSYKILRAGEEVRLTINITNIESEKISKDEFNAFRLIHKNDKNRTVIGYIQIGEKNE